MGESGCLRDGHFQNLGATKLLVNDQDIRNRLPTNVVLHGNAVAALAANTLYIITTAASADKALTLPALSSVNNGDFITIHIGVVMADTPNTFAVTCAGSDKIYGNVTLGNAIAGVAAAVNAGGGYLTNQVSNIEVHNKAAVYLGGDKDNDAAGTIGSTVTLTAIKGTSNSVWWISGNLVAAHPATKGTNFITDKD